MYSVQKQPVRPESLCGAVGWMFHVEAGKSWQLGAGSLKEGGGVKQPRRTQETVFAFELLGSSHHSVCHKRTKAACPICTAKAELASSSLLALRVAHAFNPSS